MKNIDVLIIANLEHASPRIPGLSQYMCSLNDRIRVITPITDKNYIKRWALKNLNSKSFQIIDAPYKGDILQIVRKFLWYFGLSRKRSLTEQLKNFSISQNHSKNTILAFVSL